MTDDVTRPIQFHSDSMISSNVGSLYFIIHMEMFNAHRAHRAMVLASTLMAGGHKVMITYEDEISVRFTPDDTETMYWNAKQRTGSWQKLYPKIPICGISPYCGNDVESLHQAQEKRASCIEELLQREQPSYFMIWGGNFEYQIGTLNGVDRAGYRDRMIFCEVAWFPQQEFMYFDTKGVNSNSSLVNFSSPSLASNQSRILREFVERFADQRSGGQPPEGREKSIFVPLQIESDTSFRLGSPFRSNQEFVEFLADWIPDDYAVTLKLHPKERIRSAPLGIARKNFRLLKAGSLDNMLFSAEHVIGINSTTLLESIVLGKPAVAFGDGMFRGSGAIVEAALGEDFEQVMGREVDAERRDSYLYELLFRRQVSLKSLENFDYEHLASRAPFDKILATESSSDGKIRFLGRLKRGESMIKVGKSRVAKTAVLDVEKGGEIIIGDDSEVRHNAVIEVSGRYNGSVTIGDHSVIGVGSWLQGSGKISIGDDVIIGPYASIVSTNHQYEDVATPVARQPLTQGEITIENDVWLGAHVTIATDVKIGAHSIIGANSFVNKDIPPYSIAVGSPARVIKSRKP